MDVRLPTLLSAVAALVAAGCVTPPADDAIEAAAAQDAQAATQALAAAETISVDGTLGSGFFACAIDCVGFELTDAERWFESEATGAVDVDLAMEWTAASPATERLLLGVIVCDPADCSDATASTMEYVAGTSPLAFAAQGVAVPEGEVLYVWANQGSSLDGTPVWAQVRTGQAFHIEGEIAPAWAEPAAAAGASAP